MVWGAICDLLGDPDKLGAMASDWAEMASQSGDGHENRIAELERQVAGQDAAMAAVVVAAAKEKDAAAAIGLAVAQLKAEQAQLVDLLLEEARAWQFENEAATNGARGCRPWPSSPASGCTPRPRPNRPRCWS